MSTAHGHKPHAAAGEDARRRIRQTLNGPVLDVLTGMLPELAGLPRDNAVEAILNDHGLLHRCFLAFRGDRTRFRPVLVDGRHRPVDNDNTPLACGRTINQVIAMIVRSAAKRHFRMRRQPVSSWPSPERARLARPAAVGLGGMLDWLIARSEAVRRARPDAATSEADQLYDAIRQYLLHDWQVPIIPQYARMTAPEVRVLGSRILDFRDAAQLAAYLDDGSDARERPPAVAAVAGPDVAGAIPVPETAAAPVVGGANLPGAPLSMPATEGTMTAGQMLSRDGRSLRMEAALSMLARPEVLAALAHPDTDAVARASQGLSRTGAGTVRRLMVDFGLSAEQMVVMLAGASLLLPAEVFERLFGRRSEVALVLALIRRARGVGLGPASDPVAFGAFIRDQFGRFAR